MAPPPFKRARKVQKSQLSVSLSPTTISHRRAHNATTHIFKLHSEILSEILTIVASYSDDFGCEIFLSSFPYRWLRYTHVCHHWREVALSSPRVWSYVRPTTNLECLLEMLSRSKHAPLHFDISYQVLPSTHIDLVYDNIHRARSINLYSAPTSTNRFMEWVPELPWLTEISLLGPFYEEPCLLLRKGIIFNSWSMPRLSRLVIRSFFVPWNHTIFKQGSLTRLTVHRLHASRIEPVVFEDLVEVLRGAPMLEQLTLYFTLGSKILESQTTDVVPLSRLQSLDLADHLSSCARVLSRISFPRTVSIMVVGDQSDQRSAAALGEAVASKIRAGDGDDDASNRVEIRTLAIEHVFGETCFEAFSKEMNIDSLKAALRSYGLLERPQPRVRILLRDNSSFVSRCSIFAPLPLRAVRVFYLRPTAAQLPIPILRDMAQGMPAVHTLGVRCEKYSCATAILELLSVDHPDLPSKQLVFPHLSTLELFHLEFRPDFYFPDDDKTVSELRGMLARRADMGAKVQEVHLHHPVNMFKRDAEELEDVVGKVVWNFREVLFASTASSDDEHSDDSQMTD